MTKKSLILGRSIFTLVIIIIFGLIIMQEKGGSLFIPKVEKKFSQYMDENYKSIKNNVTYNKIQYKQNTFQAKVYSNINKNHYFIIKYKKGKITDTYKKDYKEGKNILSYQNNRIKKKIYNKTNINCKVVNIEPLNKYTEKVQNKIITGDNIETLKYYYIEKELLLKTWNSKEINKNIISFITKVENNNITPNYYSIIITNKKEITQSIKISNIKKDFITNPYNELIINDILGKNNSQLLKDSNIKYKYLNEED